MMFEYLKLIFVSVCQLYMDPFSLSPSKYCRVRGVHYTRSIIFWVRR